MRQTFGGAGGSMLLSFSGGEPALSAADHRSLRPAAQRASKALFEFVRLAEGVGADTGVTHVTFTTTSGRVAVVHFRSADYTEVLQ